MLYQRQFSTENPAIICSDISFTVPNIANGILLKYSPTTSVTYGVIAILFSTKE
jgi:hypothetical protein